MARRVIAAEFDARTGKFERGVDRIDQRLGRFQGEVTRRLDRFDQRFEMSARAVGRLATAFGTLTAAIATNEVRKYAEQFKQAERQLASIGETSDKAKQKLVNLAIRSRSDLGATGAAVQKFTKATGDGLDVTIRRVETLNKLFALNGSTSAERGSVLLQTGQALQKGFLNGDEFTTLSEAAPVELMDAIAKAVGIARGELKDFGSQGKLTTNLVLEAFDSLEKKSDSSFANLAISGDEAFAVFNAGFSSFVGRVDASLGTTATFNAAIAGMGEYMAQGGVKAETFARSLELVGISAVAIAGGKGIGAINLALERKAIATKRATEAAQAEVITTRAAVDAARSRADAANKAERDAASRVETVNREIVAQGQLEGARREADIESAKAAQKEAGRLATNAANAEKFYAGQLRNVQAEVLSNRNAAGGKERLSAATKKLAEARAIAAARAVDATSAAQRLAAAESQGVAGVAKAQQAYTKATGSSTKATKNAGVARLALANASRTAAAASAALAVAQGRVTLATRLSTAAMNGLRGAMAFFGGPIGLAITALTIGIGYLATRTDAATAAMQSLEGALSQIQRLDGEIADEKKKLAEVIAATGEAETVAAGLAVTASNKRIEALENEREAIRATAALRLTELEASTAGFEKTRTLALQGFALRAREDPDLADLIEDRPSFEVLGKRIAERALAGVKVKSEEEQILTLYKEQSEELGKIERLRKAIEDLDEPAKKTFPTGSSSTPTGAGTTATIDADAKTAEKFQIEMALTERSIERLDNIYREFEAKLAKPLPALSAIEVAQRSAEAQKRLEDAAAAAPEGFEQEAVDLEKLKQREKIAADGVRDLTRALEDQAKAAADTAAKRIKGGAAIADAFVKAQGRQQQEFDRAAKAIKDRRDEGMAALDGERASITLSIEDQKRLQAAQREGGDAVERVTQQIVARDEAARIAAAAQAKGIEVNRQALEAEILLREQEEATTRKLIKSLEEEETLRKRLDGLARSRRDALDKAGAASGFGSDIASAGSTKELDDLVERMGDAERSTQRRIALQGQLAGLSKDATEAERDGLRLKIEAENLAEDAARSQKEAVKDRREELEVEQRIADLRRERQASLDMALDVSGFSGAIAGAATTDGLDDVVERMEAAERATERRIRLEERLAALSEGASAAEREAITLQMQAANVAEDAARAAKDAVAERRESLAEAETLIEDNLSAEDKVAERLRQIAKLQPFIAEMIRERAAAHGEVITAAEAEAQAHDLIADAIRTVHEESNRANADMAKGLFDTLAQAEDLEDGLKKVALQLVEIGTKGFIEGFAGQKDAGASGGSLGGFFAGIGSTLVSSIFHEGGTVGAGGRSRSVPASVFAGAPRYHDGGTAGMPPLRPGEVPAILEIGERVRTQEQEAQLQRTLAAGGGGLTIHEGDIIVQGGADKASLREIERVKRDQREQTIADWDRKRAEGIA